MARAYRSRSKITRSELDSLRRFRHLTIKSLAGAAGVSVFVAWAVFKGRTFDLRAIARVSEAVGVDVDELLISSFVLQCESPKVRVSGA